MFLSSDLLCQVSKATFPHVTLHKRRADGDFATSCTSPSLALPHSGPSISSCCGHPAQICTEVMAKIGQVMALERVSQCVSHVQMIGLTDFSSTFSEIFDVEICRATISTMMSSPLSPKLSKASSPLMSLSSLQGKLQGPSFLWLGMVNAQGDAHRFDSCETQLSLAYLSIMCPLLYSDEPPGFS